MSELIRHLRAISVFAALAFASPRVHAAGDASGGVIHVVRGSETYLELAEHYYGAQQLSRHLLLFNRRQEPLTRGTMIIIPTARSQTVAAGETLEAFAQKYLSDAARAPYLVELHGLGGNERTRPRAGRRLRVVPSLRHVVQQRETLESVARQYYADTSDKRLRLIALFNALSPPKLEPGMSLRIPLDLPVFEHERVLARKDAPFARPAAESREVARAPKEELPVPREKKRKSATESNVDRTRAGVDAGTPALDLAKALETAERAYADGEYAECEERVDETLAKSPSSSVRERIELLRLLAFARVAQGKTKESEDAFRRLLEASPRYELDLYRTSPKILEVFNAVAIR